MGSVLLTINGGSSSLKFALFANDGTRRCLAKGELDRSDTPVAAVRDWLASHAASSSVAGVAHRIVHGGDRFDGPVRITDAVLTALQAIIGLAPNHLPQEIALVEAFRRDMPAVPQVACFDTAFHHGLPDVARTLPLPGVRRFGFHGLSYTYLLAELERVAGAAAAHGRVILAHLGSGASLAAVRNGRGIDTTMGMTPAGGLLMSSRSGDLDPGVVTYLMRTRALGPDAMDALLTEHSGLLAISGQTADMKTLLALEALDPAARLAVAMFCYQTVKWLGAFTAALGGLDTLVFSVGIGEHSSAVRRRIVEGLAFLGATLDAAANEAHAPVISTGESRVTVRVIPTDEASVMARQAQSVLTAQEGTEK